jgi:toxin CcdB
LRSGREQRPFLLVVQHAFFDDRPTRVVVPLVVPSAIRPELRLNPLVNVLHQNYYLSPTEMIAIALKFLRTPIANLADERDRIVAALDLVFTGI